MIRLLALLPFAALSLCQGDETLRAYGAADKTWQLTELNGAPVTTKTTLTFPEAGKITGTAPCNTFTAAMTVPYPWFEATNIATTKRTCADQAAETAFLTALKRATLSEVLGPVLILSNPDGLSLVFKAVN